MPGVRDRFLAYCEKIGLELLREDIRFIDRCLTRIPKDEIRQVLYNYAQKWENELKANPGSIQAQSKGRRTANKYLLNNKEVLSGYVSKKKEGL